MADITVTEFTDPACPFAWSAEPFRRHLVWLFGEQLSWTVRLVGLSESAEEYLEKGFTTEKLSASLARLGREHGMPMATHERPRMFATLPACRAVVAARERAGAAAAAALLRSLRVAHFRGELLDEDATIAGAAQDAGLDPGELAGWMTEPEVETALRADLAAARDPAPEALALEHKLASWSGGLRYTCPSLELVRADDGRRAVVAGFQPFAAYEVALANLAPELDRRPAPASAEELLAWAGEPLASQEVAEALGLPRDEAREQLARVADEEPLGFDGLWRRRG
jgi:predicted DsbA family dithiol-disulfide isomerase